MYPYESDILCFSCLFYRPTGGRHRSPNLVGFFIIMISELDSDLEREFHGVPQLPYYIQIPGKVIHLGFDRAIVLGIINVYAKGTLNVCKLKNETIAKMIGRSKSNVSQIISDLDKAGYITINIERSKRGTYRFITVPDAVYDRLPSKNEGATSKNIGGYFAEDIQKNNKENNKENIKYNTNIPEFKEFKEYAISKAPNIDLESLKLKYDSWVESGWAIQKNNKLNKILNWKSTLLNTLPFIKKNQVTFTVPKINQYYEET